MSSKPFWSRSCSGPPKPDPAMNAAAFSLPRMLPLVALVIVSILPSAALCGPENEDFNARRITRVAGDHNYPPYEFLDANGKPSGFNIDVIRAAAEVMELEIEITLGPWKEVRQGLASGEYDVISGMFYSRERDRRVDFSIPHSVVHHAVFVRKGSSIDSVDEAAGKAVIVQDGDIMHDYVLSKGLTDKVIPVSDQAEALRLLAQGKHDCALLNRMQGLFFISRLGLINLTDVGPSIEPRDYCFAVREGDHALLEQLNQGLNILKTTGRYRELREKWFGVLQRVDSTLPLKVAGWIFIPLSLLLVFGWLWSWSLKRQVARRTEEMRRELAMRREAQKQLQFHAQLLDNVRESVVATDLEGRVRYWSKGAENLYGYSREETLGRFVAALVVGPDEEDQERERMRRTLREGRWRGQYVQRTKDGGTFWADTVLSLVRDEDGKPVGFVGIDRDITKQKQAEEALRQSEEQYRLMFENIPDILYRADNSGRILFISPSVRSILGYTPEEIIGTPLEKIYVYPEQRRVLLDRLQQSGFVEDYEAALLKKDGAVAWLSGNIRHFRDTEGRILGVEGVVRDVTEAKKARQELALSEARLTEAERIANLGHWDWNLRENVIHCSEGMLRILGIGAHEPRPTPENFLDFVHPEDRLAVDEALNEALSKGRRLDRHHRIVSSRGNERRVSTRAEVTADPHGCPVRILGVVQDMSEQKDLEERLQQAQKMEAIGTLAGGIAHDFNNILAAIIGYTELAMNKTPEDSPVQGMLAQVQKSSHRAKNLVKQILAFSRMTPEERKPLQMDSVVKEVLKLLRASLPSTITIRQKVAGGSLKVLADTTQIHQVVMNLCTNAFHAMQDRGGVLEVSLSGVDIDADFAGQHPSLRPGRYAKLAVSDTGCGMTPELMGRIFDPYFTTKDQATGTGLGLSVVHGIVSNYGGDISVYSEPGAGSTFTVLLPAASDEDSPREEILPARIPRGREHILLVDDEPALTQLGKKLLEHLGYTVTAETSSIRALERFSARPETFDLVITDMTMPQLTGDLLTKRLLTLRPDLPVIICTGYNDRMDHEKARKAGARKLFMKPLQTEKLAHVVREILDTRHKQAS